MFQLRILQLRVAQTNQGAPAKLAKIGVVRKNIARVLTVFNQLSKAKVRNKPLMIRMGNYFLLVKRKILKRRKNSSERFTTEKDEGYPAEIDRRAGLQFSLTDYVK